MIHRITFSILIFCGICSSFVSVYSQSTIGVTSGIAFPYIGESDYTQLRSTQAYPNDSSTKQRSRSVSPYIGAMYSTYLGKVFSIPVRFLSGIHYYNSVWEDKFITPELPIQELPLSQSRTFQSYDYTIHTMDVNTGISFQILGERLSLFSALSAQTVLQSNARYLFGLVNDLDKPAQFTTTPEELRGIKTWGYEAQYLDNSQQVIIVYEGLPRNLQKVRIGGTVGLQSAIPLWGFTLLTVAQYHFSPQSIDILQTTVNTFSISAGVQFDL